MPFLIKSPNSVPRYQALRISLSDLPKTWFITKFSFLQSLNLWFVDNRQWTFPELNLQHQESIASQRSNKTGKWKPAIVNSCVSTSKDYRGTKEGLWSAKSQEKGWKWQKPHRASVKVIVSSHQIDICSPAGDSVAEVFRENSKVVAAPDRNDLRLPVLTLAEAVFSGFLIVIIFSKKSQREIKYCDWRTCFIALHTCTCCIHCLIKCRSYWRIWSCIRCFIQNFNCGLL